MLNQHIISNKSGIYECFPDIAMTRSGTVSYTHLMALNISPFTGSAVFAIKTAVPGDTPVILQPVSYTHLDVYKRQHLL